MSEWSLPSTNVSLILATALVALLASAATQAQPEQREGHPAMTFSVAVDRGPDLGQNFGSLFEVHTKGGGLVIGAGFLGLYNTRLREDRHAVQFFVRSVDGTRQFTSERLPRPTQDTGTYMFGLDGKLHSCGYAHDQKVRRWQEESAEWLVDDCSIHQRMRVGNGLLLFNKNRVQFGEEVILGAPERGAYNCFYYARGRLFFYHTFYGSKRGYRYHTTDAEGFTKLYACPWQPGDGKVDVSKATVLTTRGVCETPFSYGQLGKCVLTCSNLGGVYAFDEGKWRTVREPIIGKSFQIYTALNFYDRLLLGQYPTGELFEFDGKALKHIEGWPPRIEGVSSSAREAQTSTIYGGEVFIGVWPWGELWRYSPDARQWSFVRRMFTHPNPHPRPTHPYEKECRALGGVANQWGQRVTGLVPIGDSLMVSTSAKWPFKWAPKFDFVAGEKWKEYGSVYRLRSHGSLSAPVRWTDGPTKLQFVLRDRRMTISQDGNPLAETEVGERLAAKLAAASALGDVTWGKGVFGPFGGTSLKGEATASLAQP